MEEINLQIDSKAFNLIWQALHDREKNLLKVIEENDEESDDTVDALNDVTYLRLYKSGLKEMAEKIFHPNAFILDNALMEVNTLHVVK